MDGLGTRQPISVIENPLLDCQLSVAYHEEWICRLDFALALILTTNSNARVAVIPKFDLEFICRSIVWCLITARFRDTVGLRRVILGICYAGRYY